MPPQNTIHSARTLHDLHNLFWVVQLVFASRPSQSFQAIHHEALPRSVFNFSEQSINMFVCPVLGLTPRALGVEFCNCSRQSITISLCQFSLPSITTFLCQSFSAIHHDVLVPNSLGPSITIFLCQFSRQSRHNLLVPIFSVVHHDVLVANLLGNPSRCSCCQFSRQSVTMFLCQFSRPLDLLVPIFSAIRHDVLVPIFSAIRHRCSRFLCNPS